MFNKQYNTMNGVKEREIFHITARPTSKRLSLVFALLVGIHRCRLSLFSAIKLQLIPKMQIWQNVFFRKFEELVKSDKISLYQVL